MLIKLTTAESKSAYGDITWHVGKTVSIPLEDRDNRLCEPGLLHVYEGSPELAVLLDPIHAKLGPNALCYEVKGKIVVRDGQLKVGGHRFTVVTRRGLPKATLEIRVRFALLCGLSVYKEPTWARWAQAWLSGTDRSYRAASEAVSVYSPTLFRERLLIRGCSRPPNCVRGG